MNVGVPDSGLVGAFALALSLQACARYAHTFRYAHTSRILAPLALCQLPSQPKITCVTLRVTSLILRFSVDL